MKQILFFLILITNFPTLYSQSNTSNSKADTTQIYVFPATLYPGDNYIRLTCANGIKNISHKTENQKIYMDRFGEQSCEQYIDFHINTSHLEKPKLELIIEDCTGRKHSKILEGKFSRPITVIEFDSLKMGELFEQTIDLKFAEVGDAMIANTGVCRTPNCNVTASAVDSIYYPFKITPSQNFQYKVSFKSVIPGVYRIPLTHIFQKKDYLFSNDKYAITDTLVFTVLEDRIEDPTAFRSILLPNAYIPKAGTVYAGLYDLLGITAGVSVTDNIMVITGGIIPYFDDWPSVHGDYLSVYSFGLKFGFELYKNTLIGGGYQFAKSVFDKEPTSGIESEITAHMPYFTLSYGNQDNRISLLGGYQLKNHNALGDRFYAGSAFMALGGDYRFVGNFKITSEFIFLESVNALPLNIALRYFGKNYAVDLGISYQGLYNNDLVTKLIPIIGGVYKF